MHYIFVFIFRGIYIHNTLLFNEYIYREKIENINQVKSFMISDLFVIVQNVLSKIHTYRGRQRDGVFFSKVTLSYIFIIWKTPISIIS